MLYSVSGSVAIVRYLCRELKLPDHWYPQDSRLQAKVDEYLEWQHNNTRIFCAMYFQQKVFMFFRYYCSYQDSLNVT